MAIPTIQTEWIDNGDHLICRQFHLIISWVLTIHKPQGYTLDLSIKYLGLSENCSGMTLVTLYCLYKLNYFLLRLISYQKSQNFNRPNILPIIRDAFAELNLRFDAKKNVF